MLEFLKTLFSGKSAGWDGEAPPISGNFSFPLIEGKVVLYALKQGARPTNAEMEHMVNNSILKKAAGSNIKYIVHGYEFDEAIDLRNKAGIKGATDRLGIAIEGVMLLAQNTYQQHGQLKLGSYVVLVLWRSNKISKRGAMCLMILAKEEE